MSFLFFFFFYLPTSSPKIWDKQSLECLKILTGHTGSVLCLQYDERVIVTGSSDSTVRYTHDLRTHKFIMNDVFIKCGGEAANTERIVIGLLKEHNVNII